MLKAFLTIIFSTSLTFCYSQKSIQGTFIGLEEHCQTSTDGKKVCYEFSEKPDHKVFYLTTIKVKGKKVFIDQSTVGIFNNDTIYSASDGGFFYFRGNISQNDTVAVIKTKFYNCDYCGIPMEGHSTEFFPWTKNYYARLVPEGFVINGYTFRKTDFKHKLQSEYKIR